MLRPAIALSLAALLLPCTALAGGVSIEPVGAPEVAADGVHITVRIKTPHEVFAPEISWRFVGERTFRSEPITGKNGIYRGTIPARPNGKAIEYRVVAFDAKRLDQGDWPARDRTETIPVEKASPVASSGDAEGLQVEVRVLARRAGQKEARVLGGGESLTQGDQVAFEIRTSRKAYVYLAERHHSGGFDVIFPNTRAISVQNPLPGQGTVRIPANTWFDVDDQDLGKETVMVLASTRPIRNIEKSFNEAAKGASGKNAQGALLAMASDQPNCAMATTRGLKLSGSDDCRPKTRGLILPKPDADAGAGTSVRVQAKPKDDMVYVPFEFQHVPR